MEVLEDPAAEVLDGTWADVDAEPDELPRWQEHPAPDEPLLTSGALDDGPEPGYRVPVLTLTTTHGRTIEVEVGQPVVLGFGELIASVDGLNDGVDAEWVARSIEPLIAKPSTTF